MRKIYLLILLLVTFSPGFAQDISKTAAMQLVSKNGTAIGLTASDLDNSLVSSAYHNKTSGADLVYLQQSFKGLPVYNQLLTLAFKNGQLVHKAGSRLDAMEKRSKGQAVQPLIAAENAVKTAMQAKRINIPAGFTSISSSATKQVYAKIAGIVSEDIAVELMWVPVNNFGEVKLAWQVYLVPATSSDYWMIRVDALDSKVIDENNLTVYCNFDHTDNHKHATACAPLNKTGNLFFPKLNQLEESPLIVNGASYRVIPYPAESPNHPGGAHAIKTDPWTIAPGNATSLKWHSDGTNDYTYTRGNNAWAYHDRTNANAGSVDRSAQSTTTPDPLTFDFTPDFAAPPTQTTPVQNQQFNITNLFYWNNVIHDLVYQYGFDEPSGNFQVNNQGRGGAGNDYVRAEAQDGSGTNNANFATPADGSLPRMQMYLWSGNPQKDGDVDNGIIVHEFGHGISNRLAGGPTVAGCVDNAEQMGEGWSDYYSLMATHDWASAGLNDGFTKPRGIGTYAIGQPITGLGIRSQRYCTNFAVNNKTYNPSIPAAPHDRGEIWCATLWDMTWNIINQVGVINPNLFNAAGAGGNSIALKLVTEGLKLQGCDAGFLDGRDGILAADQLLYNGAYHCAIMTAFARRGMGYDAVQGSANSVTDQVSGFSTVQSVLTLTQSVPQQLEGQNVTYTNTVKAGPCSGLTNYLLTDTLPSNVTYVSGGTYNAGTRVVSFPVNIAAGQTQTYAFTVQINNGSYFPPSNLLDEQVTGAAIPATWVASAAVGPVNFVVSSAQSHSAPNSFFGANATVASDYRLATANPIAMGAAPPTFSFWGNYNTEDGWDGGVVEISTNGGATWSDLGALMTENGYNGSMGTGSNNPIGGRAAFTGNSNGWKKTTISLLPFANQNALFRFRAASDDNTADVGWYIDDILVQSRALVNMRSSLFNASGVRVQVKDTITVILENAACTPVTITTQPANANACAGTNATFTVATSGTTPAYQWEVSTNGGTTWSTIAGANSATLTVNNVTVAMNNYRYRVLISNACPSNLTSAGAVLNVTDVASISSNPASTSVCLGAAASFSVTASGSSLTYQWQVSTDAGATFTNIAGATASTYSIAAVTAAMNNNRYRVVVLSCGPNGTTSTAAILTVTNPANFTAQPADATVCPNTNATFSATVNGTALTYQWQVSTNGGTTYTNITGATGATLTLNAVGLGLNGNLYRVIVNGNCTTNLASTGARLNVNQPVNITSDPVSTEKCAGQTATFTVAAQGTSLTYQWQVSVNGGPFVNLTNAAPYSGVNTNTLTVANLTTVMNNYSYRAVVDGPPCGAVNSGSATLTVFSLPGAVLVAAEYSTILPSTPSGLYVTVSPAGTYNYQWTRNNSILPGINSSSYPLNLDRLGTYSVTVTDVNGCSITTNLVTIRDSASNQLFVYPNPSQGQFQVRFYNASNAAAVRTLVVYDAKGAAVYKAPYTVTGPYDMMLVDMPRAAAGSYMIYLLDAQGNKLASGKVVIRR
ncbi:MAG: hypothetical protein EOO06_07930 [Chitinophagaceae bacterium]|nr:MAG: hypothetical protein EOO06_07930 [Chitinophagaceae bacterium]